MTATVDAVVVGAGPNGLIAANALADAGWEVMLCEAAPQVGGAVRTADVLAPGFRTDLFSAFYPLAAASPLIRGLQLEDHGLRWVKAPDVVAHALDDGGAAVIHERAEDTASGLAQEAERDGQAWLDLVSGWGRIRDPLLDALFTPFPPIRSAATLLARLKTRGAVDFARMAVQPVRRFAEENFRGLGAPLLLTGNSMHSDLPPDAGGSALFGWLLVMLGQDVGFPVPQGGAGELANALASRFTAAGGEIRTEAEVGRILVDRGRATGVRLRDSSVIRARHAVLADVPAPALYGRMLPPGAAPARLSRDLERFQWDNATIKVNWALERPVPWLNPAVARSGTVHLGVDYDGFVDFAADLSVGREPERPFLLFGQMTTADPTRSPAGTESAWAYTHVSRGLDFSGERLQRHVRRMQDAVERVAPGFSEAVIARHIQSPRDLEADDINLVGGAINAGTSALHQQLIFRPTPGLGRPETPIPGLYLASASAHPGGGVHGACGWNAARVALASYGRRGALRRALVRTAWGRLLPD